MPRFKVTDPATGRSMVLTGDSPPTQAELQTIFAQARQRSEVTLALDSRTPVATSPAAAPAPSALGAFWEQANPWNAVRAVYDAATSPIDTLKAIGQAQGRVGAGAADAFSRGDYLTAARKGVDYLLPVIGPAIDQQADRMAQGQYGAGLGGTLGLAMSLFAPEAVATAVRGLPSRIGPLARNPNAAEADAVAFAQREGIPVDAATATGNRAVKAAQHLADRSLGGSLVARADDLAQQTQQALAGTGRRLAERAAPTAGAQTFETAGRGLQRDLRTELGRRNARATSAYDELRDIEAAPENLRELPETPQTTVARQMPLPVDMRPVKALLRPVFEQFRDTWPITRQQASPAYTALKALLEGPDDVPLTTAERNLGALKSLGRVKGLGNVRDVGQGIAAKGIQTLQQAIDATAGSAARPSGASRSAIEALQAGRAATGSKYQVADILKQVRKEPVQAARQLVQRGDAALGQLQAIQKTAPEAIPKIGRAYLEDLVTTATAEGGFTRGAGLWAKWQNLGPQTKAILFQGDRGLVRDLDRFFLIAKKMGESPNPSGTAHVVSMGTQAGGFLVMPVGSTAVQLSAAAVAKLLHSRAGVRLLTEGLSLPRRAPASASTAARIARLAGSGAQVAGAVPSGPGSR